MEEELKGCKVCLQEKKLHDFSIYKVENGKSYYRHACKNCFNNKKRNGEPATSDGKFKKGFMGGVLFKKGHTSWSKLNKGKYNLPRKSIERGSAKYKDWIKAVKERDNYICRECGATEQIEAHHMYDFDRYVEKRFDVNNGVALCKSCHMKITRMLEKLKNCTIIWKQD